ncbi:MAG TPA: hypothetical protein VMC05_11525 [Xanthobacteraceae bacterium]|nr:hypothetical protein [Xanthobacteraceae bacterium]
MRSEWGNCAAPPDEAHCGGITAPSDQDLERAAGAVRDGLANLTIAFCSGLDECSHPRR